MHNHCVGEYDGVRRDEKSELTEVGGTKERKKRRRGRTMASRLNTIAHDATGGNMDYH